MQPTSEFNATFDNLELFRLARAVRFAIVAIVFGISILNFRVALNISAVEKLYAGMFEGAKLPALAQFALDHSSILTVAAVLLSIGTVSIFFNKRLIHSFYLLGVIAFITLSELVFLHVALWAPLMELFSKIGGGGPQ